MFHSPFVTDKQKCFIFTWFSYNVVLFSVIIFAIVRYELRNHNSFISGVATEKYNKLYRTVMID